MKLHIVEEGKLVPYERFGECKQCGNCCRKKISFIWEILKAGDEEKGDSTPDDWHNWEDFSVIYARGIYWYILVTHIEDPDPDDKYNPCISLEGKLCSIHGDQFQIPPLCPLWPVHPKDMLPGCSFSFKREMTEGEIDALLISQAKKKLEGGDVAA